MKIVKTLRETDRSPLWDPLRDRPRAVALGTFDGVHRGHMAVLGAALEEAGTQPAVFTFRANPLGHPAIVTEEDKLSLLEAAGMETVYIPEFSQVRDLEPEEFVRELLVRRCGAKVLCCGEDFRFGRGARGDAGLLEELCREQGVRLRVASPVREDGEKISSTRIRAAVEKGDVPLANRLLGRPFGFSRPVIHGKRLGRRLGTPTLNQELPEGLTLPRFGVYSVWALAEGDCYPGVANIGVKPTVGSDRVLCETWLPDFSGDLYGREVRLFFLEFLRPERKFDSLEELKQEILKNAAQAKEIALQNKGFVLK